MINPVNGVISPVTQSVDNLELLQLIEIGNERSCLNFLKNSYFDLYNFNWITQNKEVKILIRACLNNSWDEMLKWLCSKGANLIPELTEAIILKNQIFLKKLLFNFKESIESTINGKENETLLWHALNEKNYEAAAILIDNGASLIQPLPPWFQKNLTEKFKLNFFKNKYFYGEKGEQLFSETLNADFSNTLSYALAYHFYLIDPKALEIFIKYPYYITFNILKTFILLADTAAFNKLFMPYMHLHTTKDLNNLLQYALRDTQHFTLMGFDFEYILGRFDIINTILSLNPTNRTFDKNVMSIYEIALYIKFCLPESTLTKFKFILDTLCNDTSGFHKIWSRQRLLINSLGAHLSFPKHTKGIEIATYPTVTLHFQESISCYLKEKNLPNDWFFCTPNQNLSINTYLKLIDQKSILKIFTGWSGGNDVGHAINAVIYERYLLICNRGSGTTEYTKGICFYEILDKDFLIEVLGSLLERSSKTKELITHTLLNCSKIKSLKHILCNDQRVGNCVWLSEKMGIYACFIASFIKQGVFIDEAMYQAKPLFKEWSERDRFNLFNAYLEDPYHDRNAEENSKEGILLIEIMQIILHRAPRRYQSKYFQIIWEKLNEKSLIQTLGMTKCKTLINDVKFACIESALREENTDFALTFLNNFFYINARNEDGKTLLYMACEHNNLKMAEEVLKRGADPTIIESCNEIPLNLLIITKIRKNHTQEFIKNKEALIKLLVKHTPLSLLAKENIFPLHRAIEVGNEFAVHEILKKGFDLSLADKREITAFHWAACCSKSESLCKLILSKCQNIDLKTKNEGESPLHFSVRENVVHAVKILLEMGANPNAKSKYSSPLMLITHDYQIEICKLLIDKGALINEVDSGGRSILMIQLQRQNKLIVELLLKYDNIDITIKSKTGESALSLSVPHLFKFTKMLLDKGEDPNTCNNENETLLHIAATYENAEICQLLLNYGADKYRMSKSGKTPLDIAKLKCNSTVIQLLS